ncbi:fibrinogen C domain-containing protein 1-like [Anopheles ziemanni]|uniref:fibrinogen C domain-containing protein 1-like n=1 Tax=Anopheles coustani TaxID=139045 RepID=UPI0026580E65|nr:fibrinogen C domain-containing protein 1-like [Anopheles coustani]XP_058177322.1 fibrinogen C domain-containing protein 1-like [Anopheles ziemanni]
MSKLNFIQDKLQDIDHSVKLNGNKQHLAEHGRQAGENRLDQPFAQEPVVPDVVVKLESLERKVNGSEVSLQQKLDAIARSLQARITALEDKMDRMADNMKARENAHQNALRAMENVLVAKMNQLQESLRNTVPTMQNECNDVMLVENRLIGNPNHAGNNQNDAVQLPDQEEASTDLIPAAKADDQTYRSCREVRSGLSGQYQIQLKPHSKPLHVYCEQNKHGGGWTVFQYRYNGQQDFYQNWTKYRDGFGDLSGEFWLGLENLHQMTFHRRHELLVEVTDFSGNYGYAHYDDFVIGSEEEQYVLKQLGKYNGTADDSMSYNLGGKFTTADRNNDEYDNPINCAVDRQGAWWYVMCTKANLNGRYQNSLNSLSSMYWYFSTHERRCLAYSRMMVREVLYY